MFLNSGAYWAHMLLLIAMQVSGLKMKEHQANAQID